jgi:putative ABC transport system permease protein
MYLASAAAEPRMQLTVRMAGDPSTLSLERTVWAVDPAVPVFSVRAVKEQIAETLRYERMLATLGAAFGSVALGLVAIGVYAMFNGFVSRRSREIAIRMALGGSRTGIVRLLMRDATVLGLCGLAVGIAGAVAAGRVLRGQLFNLEPTDGRALAAAAIVMAAVVAVAVWSPARRAIRIQPIRILRAD